MKTRYFICNQAGEEYDGPFRTQRGAEYELKQLSPRIRPLLHLETRETDPDAPKGPMNYCCSEISGEVMSRF